MSLALLFMVLRSTSATQTSEVSGMAQGVGYLLAASGPVLIGAVHDVTRSWTVAMAILGLVLIPQLVAGLLAARDTVLKPVDAQCRGRRT